MILISEKFTFLKFAPFMSDWIFGLLFGCVMFSFLLNDSKMGNIKSILSILLGLILLFFPVIYLSTMVGVFFGLVMKYVFYISIYSIFVLFDRRKIFSLILKPFYFFGSFSYAIYLVHWPVLLLLSAFLVNSYLVLYMVGAIATVLAFAYLLEVKYQPIIAKRLDYYFKK